MRKIVFCLVGVIAGVGASLLICEVVVRVFHLAPVFDVLYQAKFQISENPVLRYEMRPGSRDDDVVISSAGLRDREFATPKPRDVYRIVVIGDSVTFGFRLEQQQAFPKMVEALLNRHSPAGSPTYEVLNLGVNGYNTTQAVEALRVRGLRFEPDLIIYAYVLNDPQGYSLEAEALAVLRARAEKPLHMARYFPRSGLLQMLSAQLQRLSPAHRRLYLSEPGYVAFDAGTHCAYFHALHNNEETWTRVTDGMATLARLTSEPRSVPVLVAVIPIDTEQGFSPYPMQDLHDKVAAEARNEGFQTLDLAPVFRLVSAELDGEFYLDFLHPNLKGNEVLAVALLKWLSESADLPGGGFDFERIRSGNDFDAQIAEALTADKRE
ncbi:MAG: hypothetical protein IID33_16655 [Planctomycetes bacterium]|nr:hypothetical protein [Planctomycetota bacterium]